MPTRPGRLGRAALAAGLALGTIGAPTVIARDHDVRIADFAYAPRSVTIRVGDTVSWVNRDVVEHTATATNGAFDTGLLAQGETGRIRFTRAGTYRYLCTPHPDMTGTIVVRAGARPPDTSTAATRSSDGPALAAIVLLSMALGCLAIARRRVVATD